MKIEKTLAILLGIAFLGEILYYNLAYDFALLFLLFATALSVGSFFKVRVFGIDKALVSLAIGLGIVACIVWWSTFYNFNYKSSYLSLSILVVFFRRAYLKKYLMESTRFLKNAYLSNYVLLIILIVAFGFYVIYASAPIFDHDSLVKHITIPYKILNNSHYDYNVVESIVFGDYALLEHSLLLYLMALGGVKSLVILNVFISFFLIVILLRISSFLLKNSLFFTSIVLLYFSTSLIQFVSCVPKPDITTLYFAFTAYLIVQYKSIKSLKTNLLAVGILSGLSMFAKQIGFFYILPVVFYVLFLIYKHRKMLKLKDISILTMAILLALIVFVPPLIVVWYKTGNPLFPFMNETFKSQYYALKNFSDPYKHVLGMNFHSLYSIVFETNKNVEVIPLGAGAFVLLAPITIFAFLIKYKRKRFALLFFMTFFSYWLSTKFTYNIRYFTGSLILLIPISTYTLFIFLQKIKFGKYIFAFLITSITIVQIGTIFNTKNYLGFKDAMLKPDGRLLKIENKSVLDTIPNKKQQFILSNNDPYRGTFEGKFYFLDWYNKYLLEFLRSGKISPLEFLYQFDYYLIDKRIPLGRYTNKMDPSVFVTQKKLKVYAESNTHILYKVQKETIIKTNTFKTPIIVTVDKPKVVIFDNTAKFYKIELEIEKVPNKNKISYGRQQIRWLDKDGNLVGSMLDGFLLRDGKHIYQSGTISDIPKNAKIGELYLTGHSPNVPLKFYSYKLLGIGDNSSFLEKRLVKYGKKFPYLSKSIDSK